MLRRNPERNGRDEEVFEGDEEVFEGDDHSQAHRHRIRPQRVFLCAGLFAGPMLEHGSKALSA